ncbi:sigma-54 dependent transcriptional regulator [Sorangium cellulosum]|uniref:Sigma-54 dependent transcriptional regulator n=1 Tax=Sorangium cellulosum TaxID=56 RepID=A0A2L0EZT2_SORCE|nr:sigma 54-interacting transcriptional regulator [Sorangium cellulosum]AUX44793.1 sigma-54 dependent transcriptional regulator [Sorangium cellulosum]
MDYSTVRVSVAPEPSVAEPVPGIVLIFSGDQPRCAPIPLDAGAVVLGRGGVAGVPLVDDALMSRRHARIAYDGGGWTVEDLGSTNGTTVNGEPIRGEIRRESIQVVGAGTSVFLALPDIRSFARGGVRVEKDSVLGPRLQQTYDTITRAAAAGDSLLVTGESGTGKELAARAYHEAGPQARGPFVAVNCAAIPEGLAERLLFGARRGAYSGATHDTEGYVQAANGGTLFLDEVAELDAAVQAKLLRTIDTRQVLELGAVAPRPVQIRICAATHDLRARVAQGRFRDDLYYRIGRPEVRLPPLRERLEEIPWLLAQCTKAVGQGAPMTIHPSMVIACALRRWPGNLREFVGEARRAVTRALDEGRRTVEAKDLDPLAGVGLSQDSIDLRARQSGSDLRGARANQPPPEDEIAEALRLERGNVSRAAARLGVHRNRIRRWLEKNGVDRSYFAEGGDLSDNE